MTRPPRAPPAVNVAALNAPISGRSVVNVVSAVTSSTVPSSRVSVAVYTCDAGAPGPAVITASGGSIDRVGGPLDGSGPHATSPSPNPNHATHATADGVLAMARAH